MWSTKRLSLLCLLAAPLISAKCPKVEGSFMIDQLGLYPESAAWDPSTCRLFLRYALLAYFHIQVADALLSSSSLYNCTLVIYDPYTQSAETLPLPGITDHSFANYTEYHLNGIDYDAVSGDIYIAASWAAAFTTTMAGNYANANFSGPNHVLRYNTKQKHITSDIDLTAAQKQFNRRTHHLTSGFQDIASNTLGDTFAIGTFGDSIVKIPRGSNRSELWYAPHQYTKTYGFGGIFSHGDRLVVSDTHTASLWTFNSTSTHSRATPLLIQGYPSDYRPLNADGLFAPSRYGGRIALWSDDYNGTAVIRSNDGWETARFLGLVGNDDPETKDGFVVATFDIGERMFAVTEWFQVELPVQLKREWKIIDITNRVEEIVGGMF